MPVSPASPVFLNFPPSRDTPNAHPYAIKTSSSAVLTRSNSTGHRFHSNHHYSPLSQTKEPIGTKPSRYAPSHRHTKSLSSVNVDATASPPPVPMPPASLPARLANRNDINAAHSIASDGEGILPTPPLTWRVKRSDTLPSVFPNKSDSEAMMQDLPNNPKVWTPTQLSVYLSSALRLKGGAKLPAPVMRDISQFVMKEHLSGRAFLRMKKEDFDALGINQLWKDTLLDACRALRQNLVQGRIMGFGSSSQASLSGEELSLVQEEDDKSAADPPAYSSLDQTLRRSSSSTSLQWEDDKKRLSKTTFRAGRVRGMVETYERSFSESSASGSDCEGGEGGEAAGTTKFGAGQLVSEPAEDEGSLAGGEETSASDDEGSNALVLTVEVNDGNERTLEPSQVGVAAKGTSNGPAEADAAEGLPSIEVLLQEQEKSGLQGGQYHSWGAKAWEDETNDPTGVHATARRVPPDTHQAVLEASLPELDVATSGHQEMDGVPKSLAHLFSQVSDHDIPSSNAKNDVSTVMEEDEPKEPQLPKNDAGVPDSAIYEALKSFQERLEIVEKRLDEMESVDREQEEHLIQAHSEVRPREEKLREDVDSRPVFNLTSQSEVPASEPERQESEAKSDDIKNYLAEDPSMAGIPRYVFLISLGVVVVTLRVVLKRMMGDRRRPY